jgi:DNA-binding NarL/FixJ family response regulator
MKKQEIIDSSPSKKIRVLLAEDHLHCREALKLLLESNEDIKVIGEAKNGREAIRLTKSLLPEVIVMDISMPLLNGIEATRQIMESLPKSRVLILSANPDSEYIKQAVLCGASGYLIKQSSTHVLAEAVREVGMGNSFFCSPIAKPLRDECQKLFGKSKSPKRKAARLAVSNNAS